MSDKSKLKYHASLHAFFMAAKKRGLTKFQVQLIPNPGGRIEFCISPQGHSEMCGKFEIRGNMVRAAAKDIDLDPTAHDTDVDYGGTRSGEHPVRV